MSDSPPVIWRECVYQCKVTPETLAALTPRPGAFADWVARESDRVGRAEAAALLRVLTGG